MHRVANAIRNRLNGRCGAECLRGTERVGDTLLSADCCYNSSMSTAILDREEFVEQAYFFRVLRERLAENLPAQEVLGNLHEEILTTTRLPMAIQFLATELKHTGNISTGFARLPHYFTPFQAFVVKQSETEGLRFTFPVA